MKELCLLAQDSLKHLSLQVAMHAAHGAVVDSIRCELQHCATGRQEKGAQGGQEVPQKFTLDGSPNFQFPLFPNPLSPSLPTSVPRPGYGEDRHESHVLSEGSGGLILYNPVGEPASEERNGHLPCGGEQIASLSRSALTRPWPTGLYSFSCRAVAERYHLHLHGAQRPLEV